MNIPDFLDPAVPTIMRQLKQAGYVTALYGKWHMTTYDPPGGMPEPDVYGVDEYQIAERRTRRPENYLWSDHPPVAITLLTAMSTSSMTAQAREL